MIDLEYRWRPARLLAMTRLGIVALLVVATGLVAIPGDARAGDCGDTYAQQTLKEIEAFARKASAKRPEVTNLCMDYILAEPGTTKRFLAACETILARDQSFGACVQWPIELGHKQLGKTDLFEAVEHSFGFDPYTWGTMPSLLYTKLDDARAVPRLVAAWTAQLAQKPPRGRWERDAWTRFRRDTAHFFGKHGGAPERAFLAEQLAATKEDEVVRSLRRAIAALDARLAAPAKP